MKVMFTKILLDKQKEMEAQFEVNNLFRVADLKKTFFKRWYSSLVLQIV